MQSLDAMLDHKLSIIASGATPIRCADCALDEI
jgi:hypothetical protein